MHCHEMFDSVNLTVGVRYLRKVLFLVHESPLPESRFVQVSALTSSQQAREALEHQLKEHALEAHRVRIGLEEPAAHTAKWIGCSHGRGQSLV